MHLRKIFFVQSKDNVVLLIRVKITMSFCSKGLIWTRKSGREKGFRWQKRYIAEWMEQNLMGTELNRGVKQ